MLMTKNVTIFEYKYFITQDVEGVAAKTKRTQEPGHLNEEGK